MAIKIEVSAKRPEDAIEEGLKKLGAKREDVKINIINYGGFLRKAKVELTLITDEEKELEDLDNYDINNVLKETKKSEVPKQPIHNDNKNNHQKQSDSKHQQTEVNNKNFKASEKKQENIQLDNSQKSNGFKADNASTQKQNNVKEKSVNDTKVKQENKKESVKKVEKVESVNKDSYEKNSDDAKKENFKPRREESEITQADTDKAVSFLKELVIKMGIEGDIKPNVTPEGLDLVVDTQDSGIIGHRGETLDALTYLTSIAVNGDSKRFVRINVDALNYREKRIETLKRIADKTADRAIRNKRKTSLDAMNSSDRRVVHAHLSLREDVTTKSEGNEPNRRIVVFPKR